MLVNFFFFMDYLLVFLMLKIIINYFENISNKIMFMKISVFDLNVKN